MIDFDKFYNNSAFIVPYYFKDYRLFKQKISSVKIDTGVLYNYVNIEFDFVDTKQYRLILWFLKQENLTYTADVKNGKIAVKIMVPTDDNFIILPIIYMGYDALSKDDIRKCAKFWKEYFYNAV